MALLVLSPGQTTPVSGSQAVLHSAGTSYEIRVAVDDTLCPKWGKHISGTASLYDSSRPGFLWGHTWVVLGAIP